MLEKNFEVREAEDGEQCMALLEKYSEQVPVLLLDLVMPKMNGFDVLSVMKEKHLLEDIPVIIITSDDSDENIRRAFHMGATDYIHRPFNATLVEQRIRNTAKLSMKQRKLLSVLSEQISEKERTGRLMIDVLSNVVGRINGESAQHMRNMQKTTTMLLERLCLKTNRYGLSPQDCKLISLAASLHDIGKVCIPSEILNKPGKLTPEEFEVVKTHAEKGEAFLRSGELSLFQEEPLIKYAIQICRWHHERYDGKGYPDGLYGDAIPIAAQVVSIADVFDALVSDRVYKKAYSATQAMRMITTGECGCFNPVLVACLEEISDKLMADVYR